MKSAVSVLLGLISVALVSSGDPYVCTNTCSYTTDGQPGITYQGGQQYKYEYLGEVISKTRVTADEESKMSVKAEVIITARTECDHKLQVQNLVMEDIPDSESQWFKEAVEKYDLHYSFQDGWIEYLCPHDKEDVAATNFKRGILSALQTTIINVIDKKELVVQESDVSGVCETMYQVTGAGDLVLNKTKSNCRYNSYLPYMLHQQYTIEGGDTDLPAFSSDKNCKMELSQGVWKSVQCKEEIQVEAPFSASTDASIMALLSISSTLTLQSGPEAAQGNFSSDSLHSSKVSLRMDLPGAIRSAEERNSNVTDVAEQIGTMMDQFLGDGTPIETRPYVFADILNLVGKIQSLEDLNEIWEANVKENNRRQLLLDALVLCESQFCIRYLAEMVKDTPDVIPMAKVRMWLAGSHFFTHIEPDSINVTMELASNVIDLSTQAVMAASTMVYRVCERDPDNCRDHAKPFLEYIRDEVDDSCGIGQTPEEREQIRIAFHALSNAGIFPHKYFPKICFNKMVSSDIRIASIQSYRRIGCPYDPESLWKILEDPKDEVEVRLAAYMALVPCALEDSRFFSRIKNLLKEEEVNQVGSYIWTHIQNLVEQPAATNYRKELSKLASHHTLQSKFNTNGFRSSRNYRFAQFNELTNVGGSIESNVIFSPKSYIPQHASANLTLLMLENSINIFEFGGDFSGLENYVERIFGKDGLFKHEAIQTLLEHLRPKRDIREEKIKEFQRLYDESHVKKGLSGTEEEKARASLYFRIFGNEVIYVDNLLDSNPIQILQQLFKELAMPRSFKVIDQEYASSTQLGFPLRLKLNATSSVSHDFTSSFNRKDATHTVFEGKISAAVALAVDETLIVDGYGAWSGIRQRSSMTLHSDFGGKLESESDQPVGLQLDLPKSEIAKVSSSVKVALYKNAEQKWQDDWPSVQTETHEYCSPEVIGEILGLKMCAQSSFGTHTVGTETFKGEPQTTEITLSKTDEFNYYQFYFKIERNILEAIFEAPSSSKPRKIHFLVNLGPDGTGGYIVIRGMGYSLEGRYQNTEALKELSLKYVEDSTTRGGIEMSLQNTTEKSGYKYVPKCVLTVGSDVYAIEGNLALKGQDGTGLRSSWELEGTHNKIEGRLNVGQSFGSVAGNLNLSEEKTAFHLHSKYGTDRAKAQSFSLTLNTENKMEYGKKSTEGHFSMDTSQGQSNLTLDYAYSPGNAQANASVAVLGKEVGSRVVVKNINDDKETDFQITLGLVSQDFDIDYLGHAIYKVADNAFQGEVEATLGSNVHSKAAFTFLYEDDPLHFLSGIHLSFNEYLFQAENSIDLSQPDQTFITLSGTVGTSMAGFLLQAYHDINSPFNATIDIHGKYEDQEVGLITSVTSDKDWERFTGSTKVKWFDKSFTVKHEADWNDDNKRLYLTSENYGILQIITRTTSKDPFLQFLLHSTEEFGDEPDFQISFGMIKESSYQFYQANLTAGADSYFATTTNLTSDREFNTSLRLLESELLVMGQYSRPDYDDFEGTAEVKATLPSGNVYSANMALNHSYDGVLRTLEIVSSYGDELIDGKLSVLNRDGWFSDDSSGVNFTLTTPFAGLRSLGFSFEMHSDLTAPSFAEIKWEQLKLRGVIYMNYPDNFEAVLRYEDGGACDSHFSIYHASEGQQSNTGAMLSLTQDFNPWAFEVNSTVIHGYYEKSLQLELSFQAPMLEMPFEGNLIYNLTSTIFDFELKGGLEEKAVLSLSSINQKDGHLNKFLGTVQFDSPWTDPVIFNITGNYDRENINANFEFKSSWPVIQSVTVESAINFVKPGETKIHFLLTHDDLQVLMALNQNLSDYGLVHKVEGSINTLTVTYDFETAWDYYYRPTRASGHLSLLNLLDHNLDLSVSLKKASGRFVSELYGSWDDNAFKAGYTLNYIHPLEWYNDIEIAVPGYDDAIIANVSLYSVQDMSKVDFKVHFSSPWSEAYDVKFATHTSSDVTGYEFDIQQATASLLNAVLKIDGLISREMSDVQLKFTSSLFDDTEVKWEHRMKNENVLFLECSYGSSFYVLGKSYLKLTNEWFKQDFEAYTFSANVTISEPQISFDISLNIDSSYKGDFALRYQDYLVSFRTDIFQGTVFEAEAAIPENKFRTTLSYEKGRNMLTTVVFKFDHNDANLVSSKIKLNSLFPQFDALIFLSYGNQDNSTFHSGELALTAVLDYNYGLKGTAKLITDFEGYENHSISIDTNLTLEDQHWSGFLIGQFQVNEQIYIAGGNASLAIGKSILFEFGGHYDLTFTVAREKKDVGFIFSLTEDACILKSSLYLDHESPPWEFYLLYKINDQKIKGHLILGDDDKYALSSRLDTKIFTIDAEIVRQNDTSFKVLQGNINWIIRREKQIFTMNMNSDYPFMQKITSQLIIRGLAAELKLKVNEETSSAKLRLVEASSNSPGKLHLKIENIVHTPFSTIIDLDFANSKEGFKTDLSVDFNEEKGWITASLNVGLPLSYLRFKTPFKEMNNFNLTLIAKKDANYNLNVTLEIPQLCSSFEGMFHQQFLHSFVNVVVDMECSGTPKYEFLFKYNVESSDKPLSLNTKLDLGATVLFDIESMCEWKPNEINFKTEGYVLTDYSLGITFAGSVKEKEKALSVDLRIYEPSSDSTYFSFKNLFSPKRSEIQFDLLQDNTLLLQVDYDLKLKPPKLMINSNYSHSLFGRSLDVKFSCEGNMTKNSGNLEAHLTTDASYDHVDLLVKYDVKKDLSEATFNLSTPTGNADVKGTYESTRTSKTLIVDMLSSLHTFQDYHYEVVYKTEGSQSLKIISAQDDMKFEFMPELVRGQNEFSLKFQLETPFAAFKSLNMSFEFPRSLKNVNNYMFKSSLLVNGDLYMISANHSHSISWDSVKIEINFFTPYDAIRNTTLSMIYTQNGRLSLALEGRRGRLGIDAFWKQLQSSIVIKLSLDLSYFKAGKYTANAEIPFQLYLSKQVRFSREKTDADFVLQAVMGDDFKNGLLSIIMIDLNSNAANKTYSLSYVYNRQLTINVQFGTLEAMLGLELFDNPNSLMAGKFEVNTNVQNYGSIEGTWDINQKGSTYNAQIQIDFNKEGLIILDATFDSQAHSAATPWDSVKLDVLFESPFTLSHHIHAEYQLRILSFSASYQYGLDTFFVNAGANVHSSFGTVTLTSKIPVYGLSSFDFRLRYTLADSKSVNLMISVEETIFETGFETDLRGFDGSVRASLSSPFFNPIGASLTWSKSYSTVFFELKLSHGIVKGSAKMTLEYSQTFTSLDLEIITPFDSATKIVVALKCDISDLEKMFATLTLNVDLHVINVKVDLSMRKAKASLSLTGSMDFFGIAGDVNIQTKKNGDTYEMNVDGKVTGLKPFSFDISLDIYHLHFSWTYDFEKILVAMINYENTNVSFRWDKYNNFNLTAYRQPLKNGHEFGLNFINQDEQTLSIYAAYIQNKGHKVNLSINSSVTESIVLRAAYSGNKINVNIMYGEREYNFVSKFLFQSREPKGTISFHFDSTDDPQNPVIVNAFYDLGSFLQGDMKSVKNLTSLSFEWGEKIYFFLQGMRNPTQLRLSVDINTPFKSLPKLKIGFEWELTENLLDFFLAFRTYFEWSKKVGLAGQIKFSKNFHEGDIKLVLTTPLPALEELAAGVEWKEGHAEALFSYNKAKWKLSCDFKLSPFTANLLIETPVSGFEKFTVSASVVDSPKFEIHAEVSWPGSNSIGLQVSVERLKLEVGLITPWTPFKNVLFFTSLKTESEEVLWSATLQWDERRAEATVAISPLRYEFSFQYFLRSEETAMARAEITLKNREIHAEVVIKTPYEFLETLSIIFQLSSRGFSFKFNLNEKESKAEGIFSPGSIKLLAFAPFVGNLSWSLETRPDWRELTTYATFTYEEDTDPFNVTFSYKLDTEPFSFKSGFEVKSDQKWASIDLDFTDVWTLTVDILDNCLDLKIMYPTREEINLHAHFESKHLQLETMTFDVSVKYGWYGDFLNVTATLAFKVRDQFLSRHEMVLSVNNGHNYISTSVELYSDYFSDPFDLKFKFPYFNIFAEEGDLEISLIQGGKQLYRLLYGTSLPNRWSSARHLVFETSEWTASLKTALTEESLNISFSYPKPTTEHSLYLTWADDLSLERFILGVEVTSPYLDKGEYKFDLKFSLRGRIHVRLEAELMFGTKKTVLKGLFHYNGRQQQVLFESQATSDWFGNSSLDFSIDWERNILVTGKLQVLESEHSLTLNINIEDFTLEFNLISPALPQEALVITGRIVEVSGGYYLEGKYTENVNEINFVGNYEAVGNNYFVLSGRVEHNGQEIFTMSSNFYSNEFKIKCKFDVKSIFTELNTQMNFEYEDNLKQRFITFNFSNLFLQVAEIKLSIVTNRKWTDSQSLYFRFNTFAVNLYSSWHSESSLLTCEITYGYKKVSLSYTHEAYGRLVKFFVATPFSFLESFIASWNFKEDYINFVISYQIEGCELDFSGYVRRDNFFGAAFGLELQTSFDGFEKFAIHTPQFNSNHKPSFLAIIEYPMGKVGVDLRREIKGWYDTQIKAAVYLPFEQQEILSAQYVASRDEFTVEARVGKFGITLSLNAISLENQAQVLQVLLRLNEYALKFKLKTVSLPYLPHLERFKVHIDLELDEFWGRIKEIDLEYKHVYGEKIEFYLWSDQEHYYTLRVGRNPLQLFTLSTPKYYPGYVDINFESTDNLDDYHVDLWVAQGVVSEDSENIYYGFRLFNKGSEGNQHVVLSGEALGGQVSFEGGFIVNSLQFNNSLIFGLNHRKVGYELDFQKQPGFFSDVYTEEIFIVLPNQTVHWRTYTEYNSRQFDLTSRFTWNTYDAEMPPITLKVTYDDKSLFDQEDHHILALFSHPDIKEITFQGNVTKLYDFPLAGLGEFIDGNAPERNILFILNVDPITGNKEQSFQLNISQPFSNFSLIFDAQVVDSIFDRAEYDLKYWSLTRERFEEIFVSTAINTTENEYNFVVDIFAPESEWGYTYESNGYSWDSKVGFTLQRISKEFSDYWTIGTSVNKDLPEFEAVLQVGQGNEEPYETGRLRVGILNPLEIGAVIDHKRFGVWEQDGRVGLNLKTHGIMHHVLRQQSVLQLIFEYDPSLDIMDDDFLVRLTSPGDQIWDAWLRDVNSTVSSVLDWGSQEISAVAEVIVNQEALDAIWNREESNFGYLVTDLNTAISDTYDDLLYLWTDVLQPVWDTTYTLVTEWHMQLLTYFESINMYLTEVLSQVTTWLQGVWTATEEYIQTVYDEWSAWLLQLFEQYWNKVMEQLTTAVDYLVSWWMVVSDAVATYFNTIVEYITTMVDVSSAALQEFAVTIQTHIQPFFDALTEAFAKYGEDLSGVLTGKCWESIKSKADESVTTLQEMANAGMDIFTQFLQIDEFSSRFAQFKDKVIEWTVALWTNVEGTLMNIQQSVSDYWQYLSSAITEYSSNLYEFFNSLRTQIETDGFQTFMEQRFSEAYQQIVAGYDTASMFVVENFEAFKTYAAGNLVFDYVSSVAGNIYEELVMIWTKWRYEARKDLETVERIVFSIADWMEKLLKDTNYLRDELYVWEPEDYGRVEYSFPLPVIWQSFLEVPEWSPITKMFYKESEVVNAERSLKEGMHLLDSGWEAFNLPGSFTPPFTATATVFGQHVTTFDLQHYHFLGSCTYLLSRDFVGNEFEVIGDYTRAEHGYISLNALTVRAPDTEVIMYVDGTLNIKQPGNAKMQSGGDFCAMKTDDMFVTCNKLVRGCSVTLSGKYFGRVSGLLGNYNYEPSDDQVGPDGTRAAHSAELGRMWAVSSDTCYQGNQVIRVNDLREAEEIEPCRKIFLSSSSPLSDCFRDVDPRPYFHHCIRDHSQPDFGKNLYNTPCEAVASYRTQCASHGTYLPSLEECQEATGSCDVFGRSVPSGWNTTFRGSTEGAADVAFVIEVANCNRDKNLIKLLDAIDVEFKNSGSVDVRYALVTSSQETVGVPTVFMPAAELAPELRVLEMKGAPSTSGNADAVITAARNLKWRPGVSRNIVQLACHPCDSTAVRRALLDNDITYHIISKGDISFGGSDSKRATSLGQRVFGYDEKFVYMAGDYQKLQGDADARGLLADPDASCMVTAESTGGAVFSSFKWNTQKFKLEKKFLNVIALRVAKSSVPPDCQECRCGGRGTKAMLICQKCSRWQTDGGSVMQENETLLEEIKRNFKEFYHNKYEASKMPQPVIGNTTEIPAVGPFTSLPVPEIV